MRLTPPLRETRCSFDAFVDNSSYLSSPRVGDDAGGVRNTRWAFGMLVTTTHIQPSKPQGAELTPEERA